ncbi:MAG: hypothetical protein HYS33_08435 [Acidobacteria bacterium]|nr:hypothetical protein [Acidobacteriota bacterium]MBI1983874.1 hypothetical protein [Acidobacteriota bacterium]
MLKGYLDEPLELNFDAILADAPSGLPREVSLRSADSNARLTVPLQSLKALFFVKTFDGRKDYSEVKFFEKNPPIKGLWIRVRFYDNEHLEGVVRNSIHFLTEPGFYLKPPDPLSNNEVLYVVKDSLADFRVLGVRMDF